MLATVYKKHATRRGYGHSVGDSSSKGGHGGLCKVTAGQKSERGEGVSPVVPGVFQAAGSKPARQEGTCGAESHLEAGVARRAAERETVGADHPGLPGRRHEDSGSEKEESMEESRCPAIQTGLGFYRLSQATRQKTQEAKGRQTSLRTLNTV